MGLLLWLLLGLLRFLLALLLLEQVFHLLGEPAIQLALLLVECALLFGHLLPLLLGLAPLLGGQFCKLVGKPHLLAHQRRRSPRRFEVPHRARILRIGLRCCGKGPARFHEQLHRLTRILLGDLPGCVEQRDPEVHPDRRPRRVLLGKLVGLAEKLLGKAMLPLVRVRKRAIVHRLHQRRITLLGPLVPLDGLAILAVPKRVVAIAHMPRPGARGRGGRERKPGEKGKPPAVSVVVPHR